MTHMIPGTALGVLLGDLVYTWMAFRLARRSGRKDVTAMPLGLDTPSTFGVAFLVLMPALKDGYEIYQQDHARAMAFSLARRPDSAGVGGRVQDRPRAAGQRRSAFCAASGVARLRWPPSPWSLSLSCRCCSTASPRCRWSA